MSHVEQIFTMPSEWDVPVDTRHAMKLGSVSEKRDVLISLNESVGPRLAAANSAGYALCWHRKTVVIYHPRLVSSTEGDFLSDFYSYSWGNSDTNKTKKLIGLGFATVSVKKSRSEGPCHSVGHVDYSYSTGRGSLGPAAYEAAMWLAGGLSSSRHAVSMGAHRVWEKFLQRSDVERRRFDNAIDPKTKTKKDDCVTFDDEAVDAAYFLKGEPAGLREMMERHVSVSTGRNVRRGIEDDLVELGNELFVSKYDSMSTRSKHFDKAGRERAEEQERKQFSYESFYENRNDYLTGLRRSTETQELLEVLDPEFAHMSPSTLGLCNKFISTAWISPEGVVYPLMGGTHLGWADGYEKIKSLKASVPEAVRCEFALSLLNTDVLLLNGWIQVNSVISAAVCRKYLKRGSPALAALAETIVSCARESIVKRAFLNADEDIENVFLDLVVVDDDDPNEFDNKRFKLLDFVSTYGSAEMADRLVTGLLGESVSSRLAAVSHRVAIANIGEGRGSTRIVVYEPSELESYLTMLKGPISLPVFKLVELAARNFAAVQVRDIEGWEGLCAGAKKVVSSFATPGSGLGPAAYEAAMWFTKLLMPDREGVSTDAEAIWEKFAQRDDVERIKLTPLRPLGPNKKPKFYDETTDCYQLNTDELDSAYRMLSKPNGLDAAMDRHEAIMKRLADKGQAFEDALAGEAATRFTAKYREMEDKEKHPFRPHVVSEGLSPRLPLAAASGHALAWFKSGREWFCVIYHPDALEDEPFDIGDAPAFGKVKYISTADGRLTISRSTYFNIVDDGQTFLGLIPGLIKRGFAFVTTPVDTTTSRLQGMRYVTAGRCHDVASVSASYASRVGGLGPAAYEATMWLRHGLMSSRDDVSRGAHDVWEKFAQRDDVKRKEFDDVDNPRTKRNKDDCVKLGDVSVDAAYFLKEKPTDLKAMIKLHRQVKDRHPWVEERLERCCWFLFRNRYEKMSTLEKHFNLQKKHERLFEKGELLGLLDESFVNVTMDGTSHGFELDDAEEEAALFRSSVDRHMSRTAERNAALVVRQPDPALVEQRVKAAAFRAHRTDAEVYSVIRQALEEVAGGKARPFIVSTEPDTSGPFHISFPGAAAVMAMKYEGATGQAVGQGEALLRLCFPVMPGNWREPDFISLAGAGWHVKFFNSMSSSVFQSAWGQVATKGSVEYQTLLALKKAARVADPALLATLSEQFMRELVASPAALTAVRPIVHASGMTVRHMWDELSRLALQGTADIAIGMLAIRKVSASVVEVYPQRADQCLMVSIESRENIKIGHPAKDSSGLYSAIAALDSAIVDS